MSKTYIANIVAIAMVALPAMGLDLNATDLTATLTTIGQVVAWGVVFFGRWQVGGVNWLGRRK